MRHLSLPEHIIVWSEAQVAMGRAASLDAYLTKAIEEDQRRSQAQTHLREAMATARNSGISMRDPDDVFAALLAVHTLSEHDKLRQAIQTARISGLSSASVDLILQRSLQTAQWPSA